ncbi:phage portal protein [Mesorhizobium sp. ANAO-SY3R2]|uniref:phage portal protein n=1 Tax=Mesorhizobium sp. ANAO-SY3R2 TaxID=3166644 RepID=UPI00367334E0
MKAPSFISRLFGGAAGGATRSATPRAAYFHGEKNRFTFGWNPTLRDRQADVQASWEKAAARAISAIQNSGFMTGIVEVSSGAVVGAGLRMASRPDADSLGWKPEYAAKWSRKVESRFRAWAKKPMACDAAGQMTFGQQQQAAYASYMAYGEILGLLPMIKRRNTRSLTKVLLLPPTRLVNSTDMTSAMVQGVRVDEWGMPVGYRLRKRAPDGGWKEVDYAAADADGRPNIIHIKDPAIATTRGISPFAPVLKVHRQVDQYMDANLTSALIQTIFAATVRTNISGPAAFDGLITQNEKGGPDLAGFAASKGEWYDGASIDLSQHGRIAHLFPGDELEFTEAKQPGQQLDHFLGWLHREIARGAGVTYENATGDYRGATYSSVRMAGAIEWLTVMRRRNNIIVPFCDAVFEWWLDEEIATGRIEFPGGYEKFLELKEFAVRATWTGPAKPQADDFKTARAYQVRKEMQATTLAEIAEEYGNDWDDDARQRAAENALHDELGLPRPWAPSDILQVDGGQEVALKDAGNDGSGEKKDGKRPEPKRSGPRNPAEKDPADATDPEKELQAEDPELELQMEAG